MRRRVLSGPVLTAVIVFAGGCVGGGAEAEQSVPLFDDSTTAQPDGGDETASTLTTTTLSVAERLPELDADVTGAVRSSDGALLPVIDTDGEVWFVVGSCGDEQIEPRGSAEVVGAQHVVLDPGDGDGDDRAASINLALALRTSELLEADGVAVVLTNAGTAAMSGSTRSATGPSVGARAFVSIHHPNADGPVTDEARPSIVHRADDSESRRLAGLLHEELVAAFASLGGEFAAHEEAGVRPLLNQRGEDFFRVLRIDGDLAGVRADLLPLGENEATLLATEEGRDLEAQALATAIARFLVTEEEGNGFVDPIESVRNAPTTNSPGGCG